MRELYGRTESWLGTGLPGRLHPCFICHVWNVLLTIVTRTLCRPSQDEELEVITPPVDMITAGGFACSGRLLRISDCETFKTYRY
jgi:hypothetical protein